MSTEPETTVIIPNWNGRHLLGRCLDALHAQTYRDFDIIVVDNGSTDGSVAHLREHFPEVRVIANEENRGFAAATNQGIRAAEGPRASRFIATLNNDTEVDPGWLAALVAAMETEMETEMESASGVGMCASAMLFAHRPEMINSAGIAVDRAGIAWDRLGGAPVAALGDAPEEVFGPCAGAALYRRAMLGEIGLFDEDFFAYMEDVDLAWRARAAGWRCLFAPQARVLHHHSATGKEGSPFKSFHLGRNKVWLLLKNYPVRELWHHAPLVLLYDLAAVLYALFVRRDLHALRGRLAGWRAAPRMWRQRPRRDPDRATDRATDVELLAPLVWPWRVSRRYRHIL